MRQRGFTLMELLIVITLLIIIILMIFINLKTQLGKGRDVRRKSDLNKIQKSFEEYYNDRRCYPNADILEDCGSDNLAPYLRQVPCDPTGEPYLYVPGDPSLCSSFRVCTSLENKSDPDITRVGCDPDTGCGFGAAYNYCIAAGVGATLEGFDPNVGSSPTPSPTPYFDGNYACTPAGQCNAYSDPQASGCPTTFDTQNCDNACGNSANRCDF